MAKLTHLDDDGNAVMVDVSDKDVTERVATAKGSVIVQPKTMQKIIDGAMKKGDVISVARLAGIMGAKKTPELIPLCHPLALNSIDVELTCDAERNAVDITATCRVSGRTGVEMEALCAASIAALTLWDMVKAVDTDLTVTDVRLISKTKQEP